MQRFSPRYRDPWGWASPLLNGERGFGPLRKAVTTQAADPTYRLESALVHAGSLGGEPSMTMTDIGESLDTGPDLAGLAEPYEAALKSLVAIATRTVEQAVGTALTLNARIGLGAIEQINEEAVA